MITRSTIQGYRLDISPKALWAAASQKILMFIYIGIILLPLAYNSIIPTMLCSLAIKQFNLSLSRAKENLNQQKPIVDCVIVFDQLFPSLNSKCTAKCWWA